MYIFIYIYTYIYYTYIYMHICIYTCRIPTTQSDDRVKSSDMKNTHTHTQGAMWWVSSSTQGEGEGRVSRAYRPDSPTTA